MRKDSFEDIVGGNDDYDKICKSIDERKKKNEKTAEELHEEEVYKRRKQLVALSKCDGRKALQYIKDNERFFKTEYQELDRKAIRNNTCERILDYPDMDMSDAKYINLIFGPVAPYYHDELKNPDFDKPEDNGERLTIDKQLIWYSNATYQAFWDWIHNPDTVKELIEHPELKEKLQSMIYDQTFENRVLIQNKGYKEYEFSDEDYYKDLLSQIPNMSME